MLRIPADLEVQGSGVIRTPEACVVEYCAAATVLSEQALITEPTFVLVCSGTKQLQPQHETHILTARAGEVLVMRSGTHLMSEFHGTAVGYKSIVVSIGRTFLREAVGVPDVATDKPRVVVSSPSPQIITLFRALPAALSLEQPDVERQFKLREFLVAIMSDAAVRHLVFNEVTDWGNTIEDRIIAITTAHCLSPLQVPDLATMCAMSLSSFKRHFQRAYGYPPGKWLSHIRLNHARTMILNSDASVTEISESSGYRDLSSFIRAFRRRFGMTPTALRRDSQRQAT